MVTKDIVPYGDWESPITADVLSSKAKTITAPRFCAKTSTIYFLESRETGGKTIMKVGPDGPQSVLPEEYSVHNVVYEYGCTLYEILPDGRIIFAQGSSVHILDPETRKVTLLVQQPNLRYASFSPNPKSSWVLAIEEDHTHDTPPEVQNYIVAINIDTAEVKRVVAGADFYFKPRFSTDGTELVWLEWNHPDMLFDASKLHRATWNSDASVVNIELLAGADRESVAEPRWGPDGSLFFAKEVNGYRQLFTIAARGGKQVQIKLNPGLEHAEFAESGLMESSRTYALLSPTRLVANVIFNGICKPIAVDLESGNWRFISNETNICHIATDAVSSAGDRGVLIVGKGEATPEALYFFDIDDPQRDKIIRKSVEGETFTNYYSKPETLSFQSKGSPQRNIYGFLWLPHSPKFIAPEGELPPLIIDTHGGPTGYRGKGLLLRAQYFTSRGYAYLQLNYTGSTGYGREYRQSLFGNWGIVDTDDAAEAADFLTSEGRVKKGAVGITGHSAGGYNTLQCITRHPKTFAGSVCIAGISELKSFDDATHKLESDYAAALVLFKGWKPEDRERIFRDRSAIYRIDSIEAPLLLLHGEADTVVPIQQAQVIADALEKKGRDVKIVEFADEDHMMSKPSTVKKWFIEEEKWWRKTLLGRE